MKAIRWIEKILDEVPGAEISYAGGPADPAFVDFVAAPFKAIVPWLDDHGFALIPMVGATREFRMVSPDRKVAAVGYNAMGGKVATGFPPGLPQQMMAIVQVGFVDLFSPSFQQSIPQRLALGLVQKAARKRRRKNPNRRPPPRPGTFSAWMRQVNSILLKEIGFGSWQLTRQRYQQWFIEGMRPSTAANIVIDGWAMGVVNRRYKRKR